MAHIAENTDIDKYIEKINIGGVILEVRRNPRRKNAAMGIDAYGICYIACPVSVTQDYLRSLFEKDMDAIIKRLREKLSVIPPARKYKTGETFLYKGNPYPLVRTEEKQEHDLEFHDNAFYMSKSADGKEYYAFAYWYGKKLTDELKDVLPRFSKMMGTGPTKAVVKTVSSLWGSCSKNGSITFSSRLALVPHELLEYVIVHEFCHTRIMNHSDAFWQEVGEYVPDYKEKRALLKKNSLLYIWW